MNIEQDILCINVVIKLIDMIVALDFSRSTALLCFVWSSLPPTDIFISALHILTVLLLNFIDLF